MTYHESRHRKLPIVEREVHDGLRVATLDTTPSIRRQAIKDSLTEVPTCPIVFLRQATQPTVAPDLPCYGS